MANRAHRQTARVDRDDHAETRRTRHAKLLTTVGLKVTRARLLALRIFEDQAGQHLSAEMFQRRMTEGGTTVGLATVYRILGHLTEMGLLTRIHFDSGVGAVYELQRAQHHDHLLCRGCNSVMEFNDELIHERIAAIARSTGYAIARHNLSVYGYCAHCRETPAASVAKD
jgi:Fur family transcriptional regulator, ferric uptake regulator